MKVGDYLNVPYRVESEAYETADGSWIRRVRHPELPGAAAESPVIEDALTQLERRRIEVILGLLRSGRQPPVPRPPLAHNVTGATLERIGLPGLASLLDRDAADLRE
jgi:hypothetical protein